MLACLQYGFVNTALGMQQGLGHVVDLFGGALLIESIGLAVKTISMTFPRKNRDKTP